MDHTTRKDTKNYNRNRCLFLGFHFVSDGSFGILFTTEEDTNNTVEIYLVKLIKIVGGYHTLR